MRVATPPRSSGNCQRRSVRLQLRASASRQDHQSASTSNGAVAGIVEHAFSGFLSESIYLELAIDLATSSDLVIDRFTSSYRSERLSVSSLLRAGYECSVLLAADFVMGLGSSLRASQVCRLGYLIQRGNGCHWQRPQHARVHAGSDCDRSWCDTSDTNSCGLSDDDQRGCQEQSRWCRSDWRRSDSESRRCRV